MRITIHNILTQSTVCILLKNTYIPVFLFQLLTDAANREIIISIITSLGCCFFFQILSFLSAPATQR